MSGEDEAEFVVNPQAEASEKVADKSQITTRTAAKKAEQGETSEKEVSNSDNMEIEKEAAAKNKESSAEKSVAEVGTAESAKKKPKIVDLSQWD